MGQPRSGRLGACAPDATRPGTQRGAQIGKPASLHRRRKGIDLCEAGQATKVKHTTCVVGRNIRCDTSRLSEFNRLNASLGRRTVFSFTSTSECISVSCECVAAAVYPHRLAAFAWAVVGHTGCAPGRCRDFTASEYSVCLRPCCTLAGSLVGRRRCCQ